MLKTKVSSRPFCFSPSVSAAAAARQEARLAAGGPAPVDASALWRACRHLAGAEMSTDPDGAYMIWLPSGGSKSPSSNETAKRGEHFIRMEGRETYRYATRTLAASALTAIERAGWTPDEVDLFIFSQVRRLSIETVRGDE